MKLRYVRCNRILRVNAINSLQKVGGRKAQALAEKRIENYETWLNNAMDQFEAAEKVLRMPAMMQGYALLMANSFIPRCKAYQLPTTD